jgi:hypothetical protein
MINVHRLGQGTCNDMRGNVQSQATIMGQLSETRELGNATIVDTRDTLLGIGF